MHANRVWGREENSQMKEKLYWVEYTDIGPVIITRPFEAVGFDVRNGVWGGNDPNHLVKHILPEIEIWQPRVIVFWLAPGYYWKSFPVAEPPEWLMVCQRIREHPNLRQTKIMAFLGLHEGTTEQRTVWHERYEFYTRGPLRALGHARLAKHLVEGRVKGFEGVNYFLGLNGNWKIRSHLGDEQGTSLPDADGQFAKAPITRLLTITQGGYTWAKGIQARRPTYIVYIIKTSEAWQKGLSVSEIENLLALASTTLHNQQLLIGANDSLLQLNSEIVTSVLKQARQAGKWQVFINEHLWFEGICPALIFEPIVYGDANLNPWVWALTM